MSAFSFLVESRGFTLAELERQRHELWISFEKQLCLQEVGGRDINCVLRLMVETEYFNTTFGRIVLLKNDRQTEFASFSFGEIFAMYNSEQISVRANIEEQIRSFEAGCTRGSPPLGTPDEKTDSKSFRI